MGTIFHGRIHLATSPLTDTIAAVKRAGISVYGAELAPSAVEVGVS